MKFNYQTRTKSGEIQTGVIEAGSQESAIDILQQRELLVVSMEEFSSIPIYSRSLKFFQKIKTKEITIFYRQLAVLFEANISPLESLRILGEQMKNQLFKEVIFEIDKDIKGGETLSQAMGKHPKVFSSFYVNVVGAGESTGKLHEVLRYLADHAEREYALNSKVRGAFIYPGVIFSLFVAVGALMMIYVVPQLTSMLTETGTALPFATKILIWTSNFLKKWILLVILFVIGAVIGFLKFSKTEKGILIIDTAKLKIPIFKNIFQKIYLARFAENFKTLLVGGLPILRALEITAKVIDNKVYENIINEAREKVKVGETITSAFSGYPKQISPMVTQMIGVGEKTAQLDVILEKIALFYQREVDGAVNNMAQLIEPIMILVLGGAVAFLVASILMPIYNISSGF